jgi:cobalt/nickel transport system permease protein
MSKLGNAIYELHTIESLARKDQWINRMHPLVKLVLTLLYIVVVVSFSKYDLAHLLLMGVYPIVLFMLGEISFRESFRHLRVILPLVCIVGIFNPFFDRQVLFFIGGFGMTGGMVSMAALIVKGCYSVFASYLLIATTTIEQICYALRRLHVPAVFVTQMLLTYRYVSVLISEANRMMQAYSLRAPRQKGIHFKAWGSFVGQLLLRSMDRAGVVYESMTLRGYQGEFRYAVKGRCGWKDYVYLTGWCVVFVGIRLVTV